MQVGFIGLGRMGGNMVRRLVESAHDVVAFDAAPAAVAEAVKAGARGVGSLEELMAALKPPRVVWLMVPSGPIVDETYAALGRHASPGDTFIDGGNAHYKESMRRAAHWSDRGVHVMDAGTSGGVWGLKVGYCLMVGGSQEGFVRIEPLLRSLAPPDGYLHVGAAGAGHFSKMVHNGIEYGMMQAYAEGFALLEASPFRFDLRALSKLWNQGSVVRSWLLELVTRALEEDPKLDQVEAFVEDTGEGRWTVEAALEHAVPVPVIAQSLFARFRSRQSHNFADRMLASLRRQFGGHATRRRS